VGYGPFSICAIHKEWLCPSSGEINRLMMMNRPTINSILFQGFQPFSRGCWELYNNWRTWWYCESLAVGQRETWNETPAGRPFPRSDLSSCQPWWEKWVILGYCNLLFDYLFDRCNVFRHQMFPCIKYHDKYKIHTIEIWRIYVYVSSAQRVKHDLRNINFVIYLY
jgi:hypothetical protein